MTVHAHTQAGTFNKSYTRTSLMAGAIGHLPTMWGGEEENEKAGFKDEVEVCSVLAGP